MALDFKEIKRNIRYLIFFGIGAALGIVGFSNIITLLFEKFPTETYMFFIGLILGSIPLIIRNATVKEKFRPVCAVPFLASLALVIGLAVLENNSADPMPVTVNETDTPFVYEVTVTNNSNQTVYEWWLEPEWDYENSQGGVLEWDVYSGAAMERRQGFTDKLLGKSGTDIILPDAPPASDEAQLKPGETFTFSFWATDLHSKVQLHRYIPLYYNNNLSFIRVCGCHDNTRSQRFLYNGAFGYIRHGHKRGKGI